MDESIFTEIMRALDLAVFQRDADGLQKLSVDPPDWLSRLWPHLALPGAALRAEEFSPFLENFLIDAAACWQAASTCALEFRAVGKRGPTGEETRSKPPPCMWPGALLLIQELKELQKSAARSQKAHDTALCSSDSSELKRSWRAKAAAEAANRAKSEFWRMSATKPHSDEWHHRPDQSGARLSVAPELHRYWGHQELRRRSRLINDMLDFKIEART
jgi:hypothetical protein